MEPQFNPPLHFDFLAARRVLHEEIESFEAELGNRKRMDVNDHRGFLISWFARYMPETFDSGLQARLSQAVTRGRDFIRSRSLDHSYLFPLQLALANLTQPTIDFDLGLLCSGSSTVRSFYIRACATVADRFNAYDTRLLDATEFNLEIGQGPLDLNLAILVLARGRKADKLLVFSQWLELGRCGGERELLTSLAAGHLVPNPLTPHLLGIAHYGLVRLTANLGSVRKGPERQIEPEQFEFPTITEESQSAAAELGWQRLREDPLLQPWLSVERVPEFTEYLDLPRLDDAALNGFVHALPPGCRSAVESLLRGPRVSKLRLAMEVRSYLQDLPAADPAEVRISLARDSAQRCLAVLPFVDRLDPIAHKIWQSAAMFLLNAKNQPPASVVDNAIEGNAVMRAAETTIRTHPTWPLRPV